MRDLLTVFHTPHLIVSDTNNTVVSRDAHERIVSGTLAELLAHPEDAFGEPLHSLVLVGKRLHHLEVEYAQSFAVDKENFRRVAREVYGCALDSE